MEDFFMDKILPVLVILLILSVVAFVVIIAGTPLPCEARAESFGLEYRWTFMGGCFVDTPQLGWWPIDEYEKTIDLR